MEQKRELDELDPELIIDVDNGAGSTSMLIVYRNLGHCCSFFVPAAANVRVTRSKSNQSRPSRIVRHWSTSSDGSNDSYAAEAHKSCVEMFEGLKDIVDSDADST
jgi:hypothetical protein